MDANRQVEVGQLVEGAAASDALLGGKRLHGGWGELQHTQVSLPGFRYPHSPRTRCSESFRWYAPRASHLFDTCSLPGIVDTSSCVRLSIFSGHHGVVVLRAVDALDVTVFEQDIGPTSPDVNVEENFSVLLRDPDNGVWGIQFESAKALSGFLSGISIAQDIVFSNKSERQTKSNGCLQGSSSAINFWLRTLHFSPSP